jgi:rhomboid family GlyGly-CTERM serine protease
MSSAERFALAGALLLLLLQAAASASPPIAQAFEYRQAVLSAQPWRLLTGHWVHINWPHALINAAAWFIVARLFAPELAPSRQVIVLLVASIVIGVGLRFADPQLAWYRGFSGVLHALFFAGATQWLMQTLARKEARTLRALWLPVALALGGWIKVFLEQPAGGATPYADWLGAPTVPLAHLLGAACGTVIGFIFARLRVSGGAAHAGDERKHAEQEQLRKR